MTFSRTLLGLLLSLLGAALLPREATACMGIGYQCNSVGCCNPFKCQGPNRDCPRGLGPCCMPKLGNVSRDVLTQAFEAQEMLKAAGNSTTPDAVATRGAAIELAKKAEEGIVKAVAIAQGERKDPGIDEAKNKILDALSPFAGCRRTANACTSDSQCCSNRCYCELIISKVCCAP